MGENVYDQDDGLKEISRSTGRRYLICAAVTAVLSIVALFLSYMVDPWEPHADADRWWWMALSYSAGGTAVLTFIVGSIIRAVWFLPGEETKVIRKLR